MKLHVSPSLRSALIACFAAIPSFTTSVATAAFSTGIVSYALQSSQVEAATHTYTGGIASLYPDQVDAADDLVFDITGGWLKNDGGNPIVATTYIRHIAVSSISNGVVYKFQNDVRDISHLAGYTPVAGGTATPNNGIYFTVNTSGSNLIALKMIFEGAMKDYSGDIISTGSGLQLEFTDYTLEGKSQADRNASASGTGEIKIGGRLVKYNMTGDVMVNNSSITVSNTIDGTAVDAGGGNALDPTLSFENTADYTIQSAITADKLNVAATATARFWNNVISTVSQNFLGATYFDAGTSTLSGTTTASNTLTIAAPASLTLQGTATLGATTNNGTLTLLGTTSMSSLANNGTLTLGGTVNFTQSIAGTGTVNINDDIIFNLTGLTRTETVDTWTYRLFDDTQTLSGALVGTALDLSKITGALAGGRDWTLNADGTLTGVLSGNSHIYEGGSLSLNLGTVINGVAYEDGDVITFQTADTALTLEASLNATYINVNGVELSLTGNGNELTAAIELSADNSVLVLKDDALSATSTITGTENSQFIYETGTSLDLEEQLSGFAGKVIVRSGTLTFDTEGLSANAAYDLIAEAGATLSVSEFGFAAGGTSITLTGGEAPPAGSTSNPSTAATLITNNVSINNELTATGDAVINATGLTIINGGLSGSGLLTKSGSGELRITSALSHTGTLDVTQGTVEYGQGQANNYANSFEKMIFRTGSTLKWSHSGTSIKNLQLDGGSFSIVDMDGNTLQMNELLITDADPSSDADASSISNTFNAQLAADRLTGDGKLNLSGGSEALTIDIAHIDNYKNVMNLGNSTNVQVTIGSVHQDAGSSGKIENIAAGSLSANDFSMTGEGALEIDGSFSASSVSLQQQGSFNVTGTLTTNSFAIEGTGTSTIQTLAIADGGVLSMHHNATLSITSMTLGSTLNLLYTGLGSSLIDISTAAASVDSFNINLFDMDEATLRAGVNLGIADTIDIAKLSVIGSTDSTGQLTQQGGNWYYTLNEGQFLETYWDKDWGTLTLAAAPTATDILQKDDITETTALYTTDGASPYMVNASNVAVHLTGEGGGANVIIIGGLTTNSGTATTAINTWINMTDGTYKLLVGGNLADNWGSGSAANFTGDSHIQVSGGTVAHIIGGNYKDGQHVHFTGNSYITVNDGATIEGTIIGGSTAAHQDNPTFTGTTNIFINTVLASTNSSGLHSEGALNAIIGGQGWLHNGGSTITFDGDTNIMVDLRDTTSTQVEFNKTIIAGSYLGSSTVQNMEGNTNLTIYGKSDLTFTKRIIGGSQVSANTSTHIGDSHITIHGNGATFDIGEDYDVGIMGSTYQTGAANTTITGKAIMTINGTGSVFENRIVGISNVPNGILSLSEGTEVTINGGTYNAVVLGGANHHAGSVTYGGSHLVITDGTFNAAVAAGSLQNDGLNTNTGNSRLSIQGGSFTSVFGGNTSLANTTALSTGITNSIEGLTSVEVSNASISGNVVGGSELKSNFGGSISAAGGVDIEIMAGASITGDVVGGHYRDAGVAGTAITMGDVDITLSGGSITGNVYAAGYLAAALTGTTATTASVRVTVSQDITLGSSSGIYAGFGGAGASTGTVTGTKTLAFSAAGDYTAMNFHGFDTVEVTDAAMRVEIDDIDSTESINKTGAGTLVLGSKSSGSLKASAGTLELSDSFYTLTDLEIAGGSVAISTHSISVANELRVSGTAGALTLAYGHGGIALGDDATFGLASADARLNLTLTGLPAEDIEQVIVTGVDADGANLTNINLALHESGEMAVLASEVFASITGIADFSSMYLIQRNDELILVSSIASNLYWNGGTGTWDESSTNWLKNNEPASSVAFKQKDNVFFVSPSDETITLNSAMEVSKLTASGGAHYTFEGSTANTLTVKDTLAIEKNNLGAASTVTINGVTDLTEATVRIAEGGTLTLNTPISVTDSQVIASLDNAGTLILKAQSNTINEVINGGILDVEHSIGFTEISVSFTQLNVGNALTAGAITIGNGSVINTAAISSLSITGGTVEITTLVSELSAFSNLGTLIVTGDLSIASDVTTGGTVSAAAVTLEGTSSTFTQLTADAVTQDAASTLSLGGASSIKSLSGGSLAITGDSVEITTTALTTLAGISSTSGSLTTGGALTLTAAAEQTVQALSVGGTLTTASALSATTVSATELYLGGALSTTGAITLNDTGTSTVTVDYFITPPSPATSAIVAQSINAPAVLFSMDNETLRSIALTNGNTYVLADLAAGGTLSNVYLNADGQVEYADGVHQYTIGLDGDDVTLTLAIAGNNWNGATDSQWDNANWDIGVPSASLDAILAGTSGATIELGTASQASHVRVEMEVDGTYTLNGGSLTTEGLDIIYGNLTLNDATSVTVTTEDLNADGASSGLIIIAKDGGLELLTGSSLTANRIELISGGELVNAGHLSAGFLNAIDLTVTNTGTLSLGEGSTIETLLGSTGTLHAQATATVNVTTMENQHIQLDTDSVLRLGTATTLQSATGTGSIFIGNGSDGLGLTVAADSTGITGGSLNSDTLVLENNADSTFGHLRVNSITIKGNLFTDSSRLTASTANRYANAPGAIALDLTEPVSLMTLGADNAASKYYVYEQGGTNWSQFQLSDETKKEFNKHVVAGYDLLMGVENGSMLTLTLQVSTDRLWKVSENFAVTPQAGADLSVLKPIYDAATGKMLSYSILDTVDRVYVDSDFTIDLVGVDMMGVPLNIENLSGDAGKTLKITGDGVTEDAVTLKNTQDSYALNALDAKNVALTVESYGTGTVLQLSSLNLNNASFEVLPSFARSAAEAATGSTIGQLTNVDEQGDEADALIKGTVSINGAGGVYTGRYENARVNAIAGADQALKAGAGLSIIGDGGHLLITDAAGAQMDAIQTTGADVTIDLRSASSATQSLALAQDSSVNGGTLTLLLNKDLLEAGTTQQAISGSQLTVMPNSTLYLALDSSVTELTLPSGESSGIEIVDFTQGLNIDTSDIQLDGTLSKYYTNLRLDAESNTIIADINTNFYLTFGESENGIAGLGLITDIWTNGTVPDGDLDKVMDAVSELARTNQGPALDRLASAVAGASTAGLGMAVSGDLSRQLRSIRNRTMSMGSDPQENMKTGWNFNGWINAEGDSTELSSEGTASGYDLSSWGGTVGVEANVTEKLSVGLALTCMYGSYDGSSTDALTGDVNTNYLTLFARAYTGRWAHSFVLTGGLSDISTTRTVSFNGGSYSANSETDGHALGLHYELAYTYAMNAESSTAWQPLVSLSFQTSQVDGYTESGSNAGLRVGDQSTAFATLGAGARMETVIGQNIYNRSSVLSLRAMAKADFGDNNSEADVSMIQGGISKTIRSAERGQLGIEVGAGLIIPIMSNTSSIFFDASVDLRENQTQINTTAGYRFSF